MPANPNTINVINPETVMNTELQNYTSSSEELACASD